MGGLLCRMGIEGEPFLLLSPFASLAERNRPLEEAARFVRMAKRYYRCPVVVIGPLVHRQDAARLSDYNLIGQTSVGELVDVISRAALLVTPDSGPMHIAGAVHTPVVPLFSKDLPSRWAPRQDCEPVYLGMPCSPCDDDTARHCPHGVACMRKITAELVLAACRRLRPVLAE